MPELSDGDDDADADDEEQWQWMEEGDTERVNVPCLFCDRWDHDKVDLENRTALHYLCSTMYLCIVVYKTKTAKDPP